MLSGYRPLLCTNNHFVTLCPTTGYIVSILLIQCLFEDINFYFYNNRNGEILEHSLYPGFH
jgi:hypothetical protein